MVWCWRAAARLSSWTGPEAVRLAATTSVRRASTSARGPAKPLKAFSSVLVANRGEIAIRVFRSAHELGLRTIGVYAHEDRLSLHRYKADESYLVGQGTTPVGAYLDIPSIVQTAVTHKADAIHPGYGFLSENARFAQACADHGIKFIGPPANTLKLFGDKTEARNIAIRANVPVVPGSDGPITSLEQALEFVQGANGIGLPIIVKAAHGGGGRGMRVVRKEAELAEAISMAQSEALKAFGDGTIFIERFIEKPRHIEVQILADAFGNAVHLFERDCSVQRRHQKVVEIAPASGIPQETREKLWEDSLRLVHEAGYENAGTVEFLVDSDGRHYFIEVNPRVQVEHTVTEEITGIDIVGSQIRIADGASLPEIGITQDSIHSHGHAIQCRVTTENPRKGFTPDYGRIDAFRPGEGMGIRLDAAAGFAGAVVTPHYDSLLIKVTARALDYQVACEKLSRALAEFRVRGVHTNVPFLLKVLSHPVFQKQEMATDFIDAHPELFHFKPQKDRANKLLRYLAEVKVNGHPMPGADPAKPPSGIAPVMPVVDASKPTPDGWKQVLESVGPAGFAKSVREHEYTLVADTTWRDAHQSLLATRLRTRDITAIAPATAHALAGSYALEVWGGATYDVALRFLRECPWDRLRAIRELVPNVPLQMLLRGANAVGYTSYPDNVVYEFCKRAREEGVDVFRVFDSVNYDENLLVGMDAVHKAGGVVQGEICYTGDVVDATAGSKYDLDYYMRLADTLVNKGGTHVLGIKDMAGLLKPAAATRLIGALRQEFPLVPIHVHTHDTGGIGVASMLASAAAGADVVHGAIDAMSGTTSQPSLGALVTSLNQLEKRPSAPVDAAGIPIHPINLDKLVELHDYWDTMRGHYAPFEQGAPSSASDVFKHEIPGGQYSNMKFQSTTLGLAKQWKEIKQAYAEANQVLGDVVKVTPSSKVVGDLAQFMVANKLDGTDVERQASELDLPTSVVDFLQGQLGQPAGGFPEPLRTRVLTHAGLEPINGRPGKELEPLNFAALKKTLEAKYEGALQEHGISISDNDVLSAALYPKVFDEYMAFRQEYSDEVAFLPTEAFLHPCRVGEEHEFQLEQGKTLFIKLLSVSHDVDANGHREVLFELNGVTRLVKVHDKSAAPSEGAKKSEKADRGIAGHVGASMPGAVAELKVGAGSSVAKGDPLIILSAMKMETVVSAPVSGVVKRVICDVGDLVTTGDLLVEVEES